jgi:hypothetical protein
MEVKPFPSQKILRILLIFTLPAFFFSLVAFIWQHSSAATLVTIAKSIGSGTGSDILSAKVGPLALTFSWVSSMFSGLACLGAIVVVYTLQVVVYLTRDESDDDM